MRVLLQKRHFEKCKSVSREMILLWKMVCSKVIYKPFKTNWCGINQTYHKVLGTLSQCPMDQLHLFNIYIMGRWKILLSFMAIINMLIETSIAIQKTKNILKRSAMLDLGSSISIWYCDEKWKNNQATCLFSKQFVYFQTFSSTEVTQQNGAGRVLQYGPLENAPKPHPLLHLAAHPQTKSQNTQQIFLMGLILGQNSVPQLLTSVHQNISSAGMPCVLSCSTP